jgi:dihydrofolate reductase
MRILAVNTFMSLDGVMQAPGAPEEDPTGGFTHGGWSVGYWDDQTMGWMREADPYELRLGRGTYEIFAAHWPHAEGPMADRLNGARKHVASRTLERVEWDNATLIPGDVVEYVAALKGRDGPEIQVHGSPGLIQTLLRNDLIDEFRLWIIPVTLGSGKRFFGDGTIAGGLELTDSKTSATGVTVNTYKRAGEIKAGSFGLDEPSEAEIARRRRLAASG